jgi:DNA-binding MurR/RpiR family transcriptional regulator
MQNSRGDEDPISRLQTIISFSSPAIERLAQFAIDRREEIPAMAIGEFAEAAGASQTTIVRLCKELGYSGYREFRMAMAESRGKRRNADLLGLDVPPEAATGDEIDVLAKQVIRINADILADTLKLIDPRRSARPSI